MPYAVTQGPRIRKQVADIRRLSTDVEATLKEWQATDPTGMAPFITQWTNIAASTSGACVVGLALDESEDRLVEATAGRGLDLGVVHALTSRLPLPRRPA